MYGTDEWYLDDLDAIDFSLQANEEEETLIDNLMSIKRVEAANYIKNFSWRLESYVDSDSLKEIFEWSETAHGYGFWEEIFEELLSHDLETEFYVVDE